MTRLTRYAVFSYWLAILFGMPFPTAAAEPDPLYRAIVMDEVQQVRALFSEESLSVDHRIKRPGDDWNPRLLELAILSRSDGVAEWLLRAGADVGLLPENLRSPTLVFMAAKLGLPTTVGFLVDAEPKAQFAGPVEDAPIKVAAVRGHFDVVQLLLDSGAKLELEWDGRLEEALIAAFVGGSEDTARLLLNRGAMAAGEGVLQSACAYSTADMVSLLIKKGADTNSVGFGLTPIEAALESRRQGRQTDLTGILFALLHGRADFCSLDEGFVRANRAALVSVISHCSAPQP